MSDTFSSGVFASHRKTGRPLPPDELKILTKDPLVTIGNHIRNHIMVDQSSRDLDLKEIIGTQQGPAIIIGYEPCSFAFLNGNYSSESLKILEVSGFEFGFSCDCRPNHSRKYLLSKRRLKLGRRLFKTGVDLDFQCRMFRVAKALPVGLTRSVQNLVNQLTK